MLIHKAGRKSVIRSIVVLIYLLNILQLGDTSEGASDYLRAVVQELQIKNNIQQAQYKQLMDMDRASLYSNEQFSQDDDFANIDLQSHPEIEHPESFDVEVKNYVTPPDIYQQAQESNQQRVRHDARSESVPSLTLTKGELTALYQAAIDKGSTIQLDHLGQPDVQAAVHHIDMPESSDSAPTGYYYYYFPIKSFLNDLKHEKHSDSANTHGTGYSYHPPHMDHSNGHYHHEEQHSSKSPTTKHEHKHEHKIHIDTHVMTNKQKAMEPLFMAISGFIGMAMVFVLTVLFLPKFGKLKSRGLNLMKHAPDELASLTRVVFAAIEGQECNERFICEVGRAVRLMRMNDQPLKFLISILPDPISRNLRIIRMASFKKQKCTFIRCKKKKEIPGSVTSKQ